MARCCRLPGYARNCSRPLPGVAVLLQSGGDGGGAERHCRRHRAAVGRPPCWSPGRRLVPFLGMPSTFPVLRSLGDLPAEMPADVLERPDLPLQDGATASPDAVGAVPARWLGRLWRMAFAFLVAASGVSHLTDGETAAREFCNSARAVASELRGSRTGASGHCAWRGGGRGRHSHCPLPTACRGGERPGCRPCPRSACHVGRGPGMAPQGHSRAWELRGPGNAEVGHPGCLVRSKPCPSVFQDKHHDAAHEIIETIR